MAWGDPGQAPLEREGAQPDSSILSRRLVLTWGLS